MDNNLCIIGSVNCPINKFEIKNSITAETIDSQLFSSKTFTFTDESKSKDYPMANQNYYSSKFLDSGRDDKLNSNSRIISDIRISIGEVCGYPGDHSLPKSHAYELYDDYDYYNMCSTTNEVYINENYKKVDSDFVSEHYKYTDQFNYLILPKFGTKHFNDLPRANLVTSSYIGVNPNCIKNDYGLSKFNTPAFSTLLAIRKGITTLIIFTIMILFVVLPLTFVSKADIIESKILTLLFLAFYYIIVIALMILNGVYINAVTSNSIFVLFNDMTNGMPITSKVYSCTDKITASTIISVYDKLQNLYFFSVVLLVCSIFVIVIPTIIILIVVYDIFNKVLLI